MGNNCAPDKSPADKAPPPDMDAAAKDAMEEQTKEAQPGEKFAEILNNYQAENERLKKEMDELKRVHTERLEKTTQESEQSNKLLKELNTMRYKVAQQDSRLVESKLSVALHSRATTMLSAESAAKLLISGTLDKFGRGGRGGTKSKFVEVQLHKGAHTTEGFRPGILRLNYAENEESSQRSTGRVLKVKESNVAKRYDGKAFSVIAQVDGEDKELVFACTEKAVKDKWVEVFTKGFLEISEEVKDMNSNFSLKLAFTEDKLGIRVEEKPIAEEKKSDDDDIPPPEDKDETAAAADADAVAADATAAADTVAADATAAADAAEADALASIDAAAVEVIAAIDAVEEKEPACTLVVTAISHDALKEKGLVEQMSLTMLNDTKLDGMAYSKQLDLLTKTKKPFHITFVGPKYLKRQTVSATAYPEILKALIADDSNATQKAFYAIIQGTPFEAQLKASDEPKSIIKELLGNQRQLTAVLQSAQINTMDL